MNRNVLQCIAVYYVVCYSEYIKRGDSMDSVVKTPVSLRLSDDLLRFVDQQAQQNGVTRTAMISILLNSARQSYK